MKKTDTCYYMSITKEENSAFVVANNQTGTVAEGTQVVVETKTDGTGNMNSNSASNTTTNNTTTTMNSGTGAGTTTTTTTTISTSCTIAGGDGNGTANKPGANEHHRYSNSCNNALNETACCRQETTCTGPRGQNVHGTQAHRAPQVILQVLPSTPTPLEHHNILASNVHRECRMRLPLSSFLLSYSLFGIDSRCTFRLFHLILAIRFIAVLWYIRFPFFYIGGQFNLTQGYLGTFIRYRKKARRAGWS